MTNETCPECGQDLPLTTRLSRALGEPVQNVVTTLSAEGLGVRRIATTLVERTGITVSYQAVHNWLRRPVKEGADVK